MNNIGKRGQVTMFVVLAMVIVGGILVFFAFKGNLFGGQIPEEFVGIYNFYDGCIEEETKTALDLLGNQGGRLDIGKYSPGSDYSPFSSHLNFLGFSIPYWYYLSGNNLITEQVPTRSEMEKEVSEFLEGRINNCDFSEFYAQGFYIETGDPKVDVEINENEVLVKVDATVVSQRDEETARRNTHNVEIVSKIGKFYDMAKDIYNKEVEDIFLENYALDVLQNYAPVDGVEIQCSPKIWKTPEVVQELKNGLQANIGAIKLEGSYYRLDEKDDDYFVQSLGKNVDESVNFFFLEDAFPSKFEITPASQALMVAEPVGTQQGMGIMGFCYVPYHFVYDISFPVLIQISDGQEVFQYPMAVIIDNNFPREAQLTEAIEEPEVDVCGANEDDITVKTFDANINPIEADIMYNCFSSFCEVGKTEISGQDSVLEGKVPSCVNGYLIADAEGYAEKKILFSSNSQEFAEIFLDKEYDVEVVLRIAGQEVEDGTAVIHFDKEEGSSAAILPEVKEVTLTEGLYDISVFSYGDSNVVIPSSRKTECFETTRGGLLGFFGGTKEECVDVEIPEVKIDYALRGGGKSTNFLLESDLQTGRIVIDISELPKPESMEQLQYNYEVFETLGVELQFG